MKDWLECVPNFSEGRDLVVIRKIAAAIESVDQVLLLHVDAGISANRTVMTFAGPPKAVVEAAFQAISTAAQLIDMSVHTGNHPRMGATDVCPIIPLGEMGLADAQAAALKLGERVGRELDIPVYLYEHSARHPDRKNLAKIRQGEYEGFREKIRQADWTPDFGPQRFHPQAGQTVIGARPFLIAYNINLNTTSVELAHEVACDVRESGRVKRENGQIVRDEAGKSVRIPGSCQGVKALGWMVAEYGCAQVSTNLTEIAATPIHLAFEACREAARARGMRVTGSELIGMIPLDAMLTAGNYYAEKQGLQLSEEAAIIELAVRSLGLREVVDFDPQEKIIAYKVASMEQKNLTHLSIQSFNELLSSPAPTPGGGSVAALLGSLGVSLGNMVAHLSVNKRGWEDKQSLFQEWIEQGNALQKRLLVLIDEDATAFQALMATYKLPKETAEEIAFRKEKIQAATRGAALVPYHIMQTAMECYPLLEAMSASGNPHALSDAGVGAVCVHACVVSAGMNVQINLSGITDVLVNSELQESVERMEAESAVFHQKIVDQVRENI
ncbi:MAG: glutamate formimidoyltransferase [Bacteroidota bacterium]